MYGVSIARRAVVRDPQASKRLTLAGILAVVSLLLLGVMHLAFVWGSSRPRVDVVWDDVPKGIDTKGSVT